MSRKFSNVDGDHPNSFTGHALAGVVRHDGPGVFRLTMQVPELIGHRLQQSLYRYGNSSGAAVAPIR